MLLPRTIWRHILQETLLYSSLSLVAGTLLVVVPVLIKLLEAANSTALGLRALSGILVLMLPTYLSFVIPAALIIGVILTFGRMSLDGEVLALRTCGISVNRLLPPVLLLALLGSSISAYMLGVVEPRSHYAWKRGLLELTKEAMLAEPGRFRGLHNVVLRVQTQGDSTCPLRGVFIADFSGPRRPSYITSECASISDGADEASTVFQLRDGSIHLGEISPGRYRRVRFATMDLTIDLSSTLRRVRAIDFTTWELLGLKPAVERDEPTKLGGSQAYLPLMIELHRRAALPLGSILLTLIGVPLALHPLRVGRSWGALTAIAILGVYWLASATGQVLAEEGYVAPAIGLWTPNVLALGIGLYLLRRTPWMQA